MPSVPFDDAAFQIMLQKIAILTGDKFKPVVSSTPPTHNLNSLEKTSNDPKIPPKTASILSSAISATIFVGLKGRQITRTALLPTTVTDNSPWIHDLLAIILASPSTVGRSLSKWPDNNVFVATSKHPIDIQDPGYNHHTMGFKEIGALRDLMDGTTPVHRVRVAPTISSDARKDVVILHELDDQNPIYSLYIWMEVRRIAFHFNKLA